MDSILTATRESKRGLVSEASDAARDGLRDDGSQAAGRFAGGRGHSSYSYQTVSVAEAVRNALEGRWGIPEFQREFVWRPKQICDLADSLWLGYPVGSLLLWIPPDDRKDPEDAFAWVADGQQRLTALCLLAGQRPPWRKRYRDNVLPRAADVVFWFDVDASSSPSFVPITGTLQAAAGKRLVEVAELLALDLGIESGRHELRSIVGRMRSSQRAGTQIADDDLYERMSRVCMIRKQLLLATILSCEQLADVHEVFRRLNSRGMRFRRLLLKLAMNAISSQSIAGRPRGNSPVVEGQRASLPREKRENNATAGKVSELSRR
jgi:hypothetical protein